MALTGDMVWVAPQRGDDSGLHHSSQPASGLAERADMPPNFHTAVSNNHAEPRPSGLVPHAVSSALR